MSMPTHAPLVAVKLTPVGRAQSFLLNDARREAPRAIVRLSVEVVDLAHEMEQRGNPNLRADAMAAAILAHASVTVGAMLVQVNLQPGARDGRRSEVLRLVRQASASVRRQAARVRAGDRGRRRPVG